MRQRLFWWGIYALGAIELAYVLGAAFYSIATDPGQPCPPGEQCYDDYFRDRNP